MTVEVDNIDELEALLNSLSDEDLASLDALNEEVAEPEPTPEPKPRATRKRKLKPLPEDEPVTVVEEDLTGLEEDLAGLEVEPVKETVVEPVEKPKSAVIEAMKEQVAESASAKLARLNAEREAREKAEDEAMEAELIKGVEGDTDENIDDDLNKLIEAAGASPTTSDVEAFTPSTGSIAVSGASKKTVRPTFDPSGTLKTFIDPDRLQEDLNFTTTNISMAMTRQAALFAHYSNLAAQATYQHDRAKQQVDLLSANLDQQIRDSLTTSGTKFTEKVIESYIMKDSSYQAAQTRAHEARAIAKMVETAADSFRHRKDMLIQVGADLRQEKQGQLSMREHPGQAATRNM